MNIEGKWVFLTGASRGIGLRVANALSAYKVKLILHSRTLEGTESLKAELIQKGMECYSIAGDLNSREDVIHLIQRVNQISNHHLDILYNNAGYMSPYRQDRYEFNFEDYEKCFMINTIAPAMLCNAFLPGMLERNWGRIINVTSGIENQPELMSYSCSKAALDRFVRDYIPALRGTHVLMNLLDPGWLKTDLGGEYAPNHPDDVIPGALVPVLLNNDQGSGNLFRALDYKN